MSSRPTVDGEYDPVAAAANRAAASRRASQRQEADRLRREDEAKKKAATAKRIEDLKKKQAETAATAKRVRESAERRTAAQRARDIAKRIKLPESKAPPASVMKSARAVTGTITEAGLKTKEGVSSVLDNWAAHNDKLYGKGNFLTLTEKAAVLKTVQDNPFLAYDIMTGTKPEKPPKTFDEALNRMNYLASEVALGGARDVTLPFSLGAGQPRRMEDAILQVTGGLLTPSPADLLISNGVRALVGAGKKGTNILRKVLKGTSLTSDEALQFEKLVGQYGYSTSDLRKAGTKLNKLSNAEWDELMEGYQKYYDFWKKNPDLYGAGAAYKPAALQEFADVLDDIGYDVDEYVDFLKANKLGPTLNPATLIAFINGVPPPKADLKAYEKIESDLEKYRESLKQKLEEAQEEAVITGPVSRTELKQKDPQEPGYTPPPEEVEEDIVQTVIEELPQTVIEDVDQEVIEDVVETVIEDLDQTVTDEIVVEGIVETVTKELEAEAPKKKGDPGRSRPNVFRALVGGIKEAFRVVFDYPKGPSEAFTVTARSFPQALSQATQLRRIKYVPSEVDIVKRG